MHGCRLVMIQSVFRSTLCGKFDGGEILLGASDIKQNADAFSRLKYAGDRAAYFDS